ncbi:MAG: hypothetical protein ACPLSP_06335 [Fervidicoccus fontis]|jgi:predicted membrane protein (TIGR00267 family)
MGLLKSIEKTKKMLGMMENVDVKSIARRLFVMNSFDGLLTSIGVIIGTHISGSKDPIVYIWAIVGGIITVGIFSNFIGVYMTERAERINEVKEIEKHLLTELKNTYYEVFIKLVPIYIATWSMMGALFSLISILPLILSLKGVILLDHSLISSVVMSNIQIAFIGAYLGKISKESVIKEAARFSLIGLSATAFLYIVSLFFER